MRKGLEKIKKQLLDINNLKRVNDSFGHQEGDFLLKQIAYAVKQDLDKIDTVIRYGGDEFIIIFCCIPSDLFKKRLKIIRTSVNMLEFMNVQTFVYQ